MINCSNNQLLNNFTLCFDMHNRNWRMYMEYIKWWQENIYYYYLKKKEKKERKKKKFKIVKISLKNTFKSTIFAGFFLNDIGANILKIIFYIDFSLATCLRHGKSKSKLLIVLNLTPICISKKVPYSDEWFVCIVVTGRRNNLFLITSRILNNVSKPTSLVRVWIIKRGASLEN